MDKRKILMYGGVGVGVIVLFLIMKRSPAASTPTTTDASGGVNTQQPVIIPTGGDSGAAVTAMGQSLNDNLVRGFQSIQQIITAQNTPANVPAPVVHTFLGADADIAGAMSVFNGSQYKFIDTQGMTTAQKKATLASAVNPLIIGGAAAGGGISEADAAGTGIVRIGGTDRQDTLKQLQAIRF